MDDIDLSSVKPLLQRLCIAPDKTHMRKIAFLLIELAHGDAGDAHIFLDGDPAVLRIAFRHLVPVISLSAADLQVQFLPVNERSPAPFQLRGILDDHFCILQVFLCPWQFSHSHGAAPISSVLPGLRRRWPSP